VDDDSDDEETNADLLEQARRHTKAKKKLVQVRKLPAFDKLYGLNRVVCGQTIQSEKTSKCMFPWHILICDHYDRELTYVDPATATPNKKFGLSLYFQSAFTESTADSKAYDTEFLGKAFAFLSMHGTTNLMKKAITFYIAHLRAEHRIRMQYAGNRSAALGDAKLGNNQDIGKQLQSALGKTTMHAMDQMYRFTRCCGLSHNGQRSAP